MSRQRPALGLPPDVSRFPRTRLRTDHPLYRAHTVGKSPWWFSSDLTGRFDLLPPDGTCYLATDVITALRERFGHDLVRQGVVTFEAAARTSVSTLQVPVARWLANTCSAQAAAFVGMTREIGTCPSYELPQAWAAAFFATGRHAGIRYQTRFSTGPAANAVALFDDAGQRDWSVDPSPVGGVEACEGAGITVAHRPTRRQVRILPPPG
ncbi:MULTISPECIES: RES family NAD+ phosphorylase [unclassified Mycolicibacterium]|uniref:RES family NAD+ phosphorylase n=1 Tax=unclassified Mycolicibacterium TaxID=2636767 RepID=UPI0012DD8A9E|nr:MULTISPECIES: RES family NAD+ phosphorylase [unclassified Mycolicibacterium]MUL84543.1 RES family NAD+ phosphorylase [Mycolicibacterium sp. CBMA 329]MUL88318.1 RES family NAD+ phosphorylase [Mycolicibacterium sp. CBMA 331]MUL99233.1 RES family NAD+ phosphorylase [Mycolicibacterium sp. CBMA 334]MUM27597.1 RES family NAD+ phosphorylase [Mycolicibacterium sp. CBMA 295]MUM39965.1 RES family NAD+ phosphorylase [Mycolicibacterium sp. CBMA 247]